MLVADLSQTATLNFIAGPINNIISRGFPLRFGVVPSVETEDGELAVAQCLEIFGLSDVYLDSAKKMARLYYHMIDTFGRAKTMGFLSQVLSSFPSMISPNSNDDGTRSVKFECQLTFYPPL